MKKEEIQWVEKIEIWQKTDQGGEAIEWPSGKHLKLVAVLINGRPIKLEKDFNVERVYITKEEAKLLESPHER